MRGLRWVLGVVAGLAGAAPAFANDSTAELTTGGLVLAKTADIEMRSEDLAISQTEISVRYRYYNHSASDKTVTVAFPMPDVNLETPDTNVALPDPESPNFLAFHTIADGREVQAQNEQKAFAGGRDVTAKLKQLGVPLAPESDATAKALEALPDAAKAELVKLGIARPNDYDVGKGLEHHIEASWTLKSTFFWSQTFPAGREIVVEHRYTPSVGDTVGTVFNMEPMPADQLREYENRYCVDKDFIASALRGRGKLDANGSPTALFYERRIAYVLKTAANWAGPIGDFRLTVDKGSTEALISFCADGVKKIGPTLFEVRHANFTPTQDLHILILYHPKT